MTDKKSIKKGLIPQHVGLIREGEENIYMEPPSQYALAFIGVSSRTELKSHLENIVESIETGVIRTEDVPILSHYVNNSELTIQTLEQLARSHDKTAKIITHEAILTSDSGYQFTASQRGQVSCHVNPIRPTRERVIKRSTGEAEVTHRQPISVSIYNPQSLEEHRFAGGTKHEEKNQKKGHHWCEGLSHEKRHMQRIAKDHPEAYAAYTRNVEIAGYTRACALVGLHKALNSDKEHLVKGAQNIDDKAELPFDFSPKETTKGTSYAGTALAFEAFLLRYSPMSVRREVLGQESARASLADVDQSLMGKLGFVTPEARRVVETGTFHKGAILQTRHIPEIEAAIIQAFEEHMLDQGRQFKGYSFECVDEPDYRTMSIVFDGESRTHDHMSVRILYDEHTKLPFVEYKVFKPSRYKGKHHLNGRDPMTRVNMPKDVKKSRPLWWRESDWRSGAKEESLCLIYEPTRNIRRRAAQILRENGKEVWNPRLNRAIPISENYIRGMYMNLMEERRNKIRR